MTLIFSHISDQTGLLVASDLITSRPSRYDKEELQLPVRDGPLIHSNAGSSLAGLTQKTCIINRSLISFAGSVIVAKAIIERFREESADGTERIDLQKLARSMGFNQSELDSVSFLYHFANGNYINRQVWNCLDLNQGKFENIVGQGSGVWNFFANMQARFDTEPTHVQVVQGLVSRIANNYLGEILGTETLDYMYGGWFELASRQGNSFAKVPYGVKFWSQQGGVLGSGGPALMSWYNGFHLNVTRFPITGEGPDNDTPPSTIFVQDLLNRGLAGPPRGVIRPTFVVHLIIDLDRKNQRIIYTSQPEQDGFHMAVSPEGMRLQFTRDFFRKLSDRMRLPQDAVIRPIDLGGEQGNA
ncbi:hypothetical protein [Sphingomonas sp. Leaf231]|uniref:hypothetical protein n=1 Tax=Sphingomonas sp. Leaf231 TaxID=1736301 RepID=UPI000AB1D75D|nr:hypothetical protein [Sphingomonas sp. Leaf231]